MPVGPGKRGCALVPSDRAPFRCARSARRPAVAHRLHLRVGARGAGRAVADLGRAGRRSRGDAGPGGGRRRAGRRSRSPRRRRSTGTSAGCGEGEGCVFGPAWADVDRNGCDQRNDVLHRDLTEVQVREGTQGCVVIAGRARRPVHRRDGALREGRRRRWCRSTTSSRWPPRGCRGRRPGRRTSAQAFANDLTNLIGDDAGRELREGRLDRRRVGALGPHLRLLVRHRRHHGEGPLRPRRQPGGVGGAAVAARHLLSAAPTGACSRCVFVPSGRRPGSRGGCT